MNAEAIIAISAATVALTQLLKWSGIPDKTGPIAVLVLAALGVGMWGYSTEPTWSRDLIFVYFSAWIAVATSAAGTFGFTRAAGAAVISANPNTPALTAATAPPLVQRELEALASAVGGQHSDIERIEQAIRDMRADLGLYHEALPEDPARISTRQASGLPGLG